MISVRRLDCQKLTFVEDDFEMAATWFNAFASFSLFSLFFFRETMNAIEYVGALIKLTFEY